MVHIRALAVIAAGLAVAHVHLASAVSAPEEPRENELASPCRSARHGAALARRIVGDHALVPLELLPRDVAFVLVLDQHIPFRHRTPQSAPHALAAILDDRLARRAPEGIGAGIDRIGEDVVDGVVQRQLPDDRAAILVVRLGRQLDAFLPQPDVHLAHALELRELREDELQSAPARAGRDPSRSDRGRSSHSPPRRRGTAHRDAPCSSAPPASAGGTATAPARSSCPSCRATIDHWGGEDRRFRPRRR